MKKVVIGAAMLISGVIGLVGQFIACALTVQPGGRSRVWGCLDGMEWLPVIAFTVLAVYGLVLALKNCEDLPKQGGVYVSIHTKTDCDDYYADRPHCCNIRVVWMEYYAI